MRRVVVTGLGAVTALGVGESLFLNGSFRSQLGGGPTSDEAIQHVERK